MKHHAPSSPSKEVLSANGLTKAYGGAVVLTDLSFSLKAGKVLGLLGPNGAGKTTAIRILTTIIPPTSGSFQICGLSGRSADQIRRHIGVLPESAGLPVGLTASEFMAFFCELYGHNRKEARARGDALLASVGLPDKGQVLVSKFSRGMRQRLGIARSVCNDPSVIFLDEPTLGLDPAGQAELLALIKKLALEKSAGIIFCSHLLAEVERLCDDVIILNKGRVVANGSVADISSQNTNIAIRLQVPESASQIAQGAIEKANSGIVIAPTLNRPGWIDLSLSSGQRPSAEELTDINLKVLGTLVGNNIPVLNIETGQGRLEEAFLSLTQS